MWVEFLIKEALERSLAGLPCEAYNKSMIQKRALTWSCWSLTSDFHSPLLGTSTGDPTHDKVMWKRPDRQGGSGLKGLPGPAWTSTLKPKSVCLLFTILCLSPTLLTLTGGYPRPPFSEENQLRALVNKSPVLERSISILTSLLAF